MGQDLVHHQLASQPTYAPQCAAAATLTLHLSEQGARVLHDAAELALRTSRLERASGLALQMIALAQCAGDDSLIAIGLNVADRIEGMTKDPELLADVAMCRAIAARETADFSTAERHAREALEGYRARLRVVKDTPDTDDSLDFVQRELHNDLSSALGMLGFALLSQGKYDEAAEAYRHSLQHERGASIAVNRGQTLHQIGNCESNLGNHKTAQHSISRQPESSNLLGWKNISATLSES